MPRTAGTKKEKVYQRLCGNLRWKVASVDKSAQKQGHQTNRYGCTKKKEKVDPIDNKMLMIVVFI